MAAAKSVSADVAVIGAGASGLAAAIIAARRRPHRRIIALDGARKLGAKLLVTGGGRCNVTNTVVTPADYRGGSRNIIRRILNAFTVEQTVAFFREIGVNLHAEEGGKLFPDTNRAATVLDALAGEARARGVRILSDHRVLRIQPRADSFEITTRAGVVSAEKAILATGGRSFPKSGSDGTGYQFAQELGHSLIPTTPALVPLILDGWFHAGLSGITQDVELTLRSEGSKPLRLRGSLLWTHFGVSGPVVLDASGPWHRARIENCGVSVAVSFLPGDDLQTVEGKLAGAQASRPTVTLAKALAVFLPSRVALAVLKHLQIEKQMPMAHLSRDNRRKLAQALLNWPLAVRESCGYEQAEVTAGGVPLNEIDPATMASRKCPELYLVGEILDVDGRLGGFNLQWAWSSAWVAGGAV